MITEAHEAAANVKTDLSAIRTFADAVEALGQRGVTGVSHGMQARDNMAEALLERAQASRRRVYDQYGAAFRNVSAYIVFKGDKPVAKVAFKFGNAVTAYVHWLGVEMVRGQAIGGGYDRQSTAVAYAARKIPEAPYVTTADAQERGNRDAFLKATRADDGRHWDGALRDAGFTVLQAV